MSFGLGVFLLKAVTVSSFPYSVKNGNFFSSYNMKTAAMISRLYRKNA